MGGKTCIECIDLVERADRKTSEPFFVAFLHFTQTGVPSTKELVTFVQRIEAGDEIKIEYRHPWFWKVRKNNAKRRGRTGGPRVLLSEEDVSELKSFQKEYQARKTVEPAHEEVPQEEN